MGVIYKTEKRRMLPRWRSVESESTALEPSTRTNSAVPGVVFVGDLLEQEESWGAHKSLAHASDLLTSSQVLGRDHEYQQVARFVLDHSRPQSLLSRLAESTIHKVDGPAQRSGTSKKLESERHDRSIARLRRLLRIESRNAIAWIEIARHYVVVGESKKARRAVLSALAVDKDSRFVVRSSARYFHHADESDYAIKILQHSDRWKTDPWIMASEIAFASLLGRQTRMAKKGLELVEAGAFRDMHISELASALGSLELEHGKLKNARRLAAISMKMPNDNSFAQAMWNREAFDIPQLRFETMTIPMAWEAMAQLQYQNENFLDALKHLERWRADEPFSVRPIQLLSYVNGTILQDWSSSIEIIKKARLLHPDDLTLQNNLVYDYLMSNRVEEAEKELPALIALMNSVSDERKAVASATWGLLMFRKGEYEQGRDLYRKAIRVIAASGNSYLRAMAVSNYVREELLAQESQDLVETALQMEERYSRSRTEYDVRQLVARNESLRGKIEQGSS